MDRKNRFNEWLDTIESRWSLWTLVQGSSLVASFGLPAWAVHSADILSQYSPFSWVAAGFLGVLIWAIARLCWQVANRIRITSKFDELQLEKGSCLNPLDTTFERKRIFLADFVLPSHPNIDGKTFVNCELIGPANIYLQSGNQATLIRAPKIDAVWLAPTAKFLNGFVFTNCVFRSCSFQRITMFASLENFESWKDSPSANWIGISPNKEHLAERKAVIESLKKPKQPPEAKLIEAPKKENN